MGRYFEFSAKHPEVDIGIMLTVYTRCPRKKPANSEGRCDLEECYEHVQNCPFCKRMMREEEESLAKFVSHEHIPF